MNKELEKEYERLNKTEATRWQMMEYSWAIKALAEGLSARSVWEQFRNIEQAQRYLTEFRSHFTKAPELNEKEANLAMGLHTYMRKGMDSNLSCMLYRMVAEGRGVGVWYAFVKGLAANKNNYQAAIREAHNQQNLDKSTDNQLMYHALCMWENEWLDPQDWVTWFGKQ
jgi:hypothetical protein